ncbi:uncharacterized protein LOC143241013 isoform X2 [Tachypleus tridentatus]|uniref:uncharacterized protein LOC143241013 isoform X2 n=1 Tax=Tachypleus tridentatus TaxID=6853 RepID=UPI003FD2A647
MLCCQQCLISHRKSWINHLLNPGRPSTESSPFTPTPKKIRHSKQPDSVNGTLKQSHSNKSLTQERDRNDYSSEAPDDQDTRKGHIENDDQTSKQQNNLNLNVPHPRNDEREDEKIKSSDRSSPLFYNDLKKEDQLTSSTEKVFKLLFQLIMLCNRLSKGVKLKCQSSGPLQDVEASYNQNIAYHYLHRDSWVLIRAGCVRACPYNYSIFYNSFHF